MIGLLLALSSAHSAVSVADLNKAGNRIVLISDANEHDPPFLEQRLALSRWLRQAEERDVVIVELGEKASRRSYDGTLHGLLDKAADLRRMYGLSPRGFAVALVGKDGHVALRAARPVSGARLQAAIDAMPMRRAGFR